jgi:hypothetical protein
MKFVEQLVDVTDVEVIGDHRLCLTFADGVVGEVSFEDRDWKVVLAPLADAESFAQVRVDSKAGTIAWPNGIDFAPERCTPRQSVARSRASVRRLPAYQRHRTTTPGDSRPHSTSGTARSPLCIAPRSLSANSYSSTEREACD